MKKADTLDLSVADDPVYFGTHHLHVNIEYVAVFKMLQWPNRPYLSYLRDSL